MYLHIEDNGGHQQKKNDFIVLMYYLNRKFLKIKKHENQLDNQLF